MSADRYSPAPKADASGPPTGGVWRAPESSGPLQATLTIPGSKSLTNRELVLASLAEGPGRIIAPLHSDDSARMIDALRALGVGIETEPGDSEYGDDLLITPVAPFAGGGHWALPFTVRGRGHVRGGEVSIDASVSSQFVSGLLLTAPRLDVGLHLVHTGARLPSIPHIDMTIESLAHRGVRVERPAPGE